MDKYIVRLTADERIFLDSIIKIGKANAKKIQYAHILLESDVNNPEFPSKKDSEIAEILRISINTVRRVRRRLVLEGLESSLSRKPHPRTRPRIVDGEQEAHLIALCCSPPPEGRCRWTLKILRNKYIELQ